MPDMINDAARPRVTITLYQEVADALACYLDEEEVFDDVVGILLKAIPLTVPEAPMVTGITRETVGKLHMTSFIYGSEETFEEFCNKFPHTVANRRSVFQIIQRDKDPGPTIRGYNTYDTTWDEQWFEEYPPEDAYIVGYWHHHSWTFFYSNQHMIDHVRQYNA